ncbi:tape measure protein [Magnetospirillum molischianum]|uniref:Uncharacterized protein n=1 Tax=Magnetospirillum molischianum DSM 120 TaxID=1150626 RepID=H8FY58_MAGML|nr:tape measure protein [Magnetospirillum molischianum]CCG43296.1 hypothetical protein PHAMO_80087 [Magnetospirillum molischianum DSM 120]
MRAGVIRVELELENGEFTHRLVKAGTDLNALQNQLGSTIVAVKRMDSASLGLGRTLHDFVTTVGLAKAAMSNLWGASGGWISNIVKTNGELERMQMLMKGMSTAATTAGRTSEAKENVSWLMSYAKEAPFSLSALNDTFVKFATGGLDNTRSKMRALVDATAAFGGTEDQLHRAAIAIQQMAGKGVISMEELRQQLGEAVPTAMKAMAIGSGVSMAELAKTVSKGVVESKTAMERMFATMQLLYGGSAQEMMSSFTGLLSQIETRWVTLQKTIGDGGGGEKNGFYATVKQQLVDIIALSDDPRVNRIGDSFGAGLKDTMLQVRNIVVEMASWRQEIGAVAMALGALVAANVVSSFLNGIRNMLVAGVMDWKVYSAGVKTAAADVVAAAALMRQATTATQAMSMAVTGAGAAVTMFGRALGMLTGPIGIALTFLTILAIELDLFKSKTAAAAESYAAFKRGIYDQKQIETATEDIKALTDKIAELEDTKRRRQKDSTDPSMSAVQRRNALIAVADLEEKIAKKRQQIAERQGLLDSALSEQRETEARQVATRNLARLNQEVASRKAVNDKEINDRFEQFQKEYDALGNNEAAKLKLRDKFFAENHARADQYYGDVIAMAQKEVDIWRQKAAAGGDQGQIAQARESLKLAEERLETLRAERRLQQEQNFKALKLNTDKNDPAAEKAKTQFDQLKTAIVNAQGALASIHAQMKGGNADLAKFDAKIDAGQFSEALKSLPEAQKAYAKLREIIKQTGEAKLELENQQAREKIDNIFRSMDDSIAKSSERLEEFKRELTDDTAARFGGEYANAMAQIEKKARDVAETEKATAEDRIRAEEKVAAAKQGWINQYAASQALKWREANQQEELELAKTEDAKRAIREKHAQIEIERIRTLADSYAKSENGKVEITEAAAKRIEAIQAQLAEANKGPIRRMFDSWSDYTARMEEAGARWIDGFTDKLVDFAVTGKATFADFAESILRDILKMQYQAAIAQASSGWLGNALSGLGSAIGGFLGGGSTPSSGLGDYGSVGGGSMVAQAHTGGIVGADGLAMRRVDPSWFESAPKFHTGGVVRGLKNDEVPAVLRKGEGVFTEEQMKALGRDRGGANVQINVINQTGQGVTAEQGQPRFDGEQMVLDIVLRAASRPGAFRDGMKGAMS